jgi:hypothetical protein
MEEMAAESAESGTMELLPLSISESEFLNYLSTHQSQLDYGQRHSFGDAEAVIKEMKEGYE